MDYLKQAKVIIRLFKPGLENTKGETVSGLITERLPFTIAMAFEAGVIAMPIYVKARQGEASLGLTDKNDRENGYSSPLTIADTKVHDRTFELYHAQFPQDTFEGEESEHTAHYAQVTLVQDEIDGTQNYALGYGSFSYVNALYYRPETTAEDIQLTSLVYDPLHKVLFLAVRGVGAFRFALSDTYEVTHWRSIQVANLDVRTAKTPPYILMDTMGLGEDPILRRTLQKLGYKVEPLSGSGLKVAVVASENVVCAVFRSQRGNPDPWDIAAASLLVTEGKTTSEGDSKNRGKATSLSGGKLLNAEWKFYDGYAIGAPLAHNHIVTAHTLIEKALKEKETTQNDMTPTDWDVFAGKVAAEIRTRYF